MRGGIGTASSLSSLSKAAVLYAVASTAAPAELDAGAGTTAAAVAAAAGGPGATARGGGGGGGGGGDGGGELEQVAVVAWSAARRCSSVTRCRVPRMSRAYCDAAVTMPPVGSAPSMRDVDTAQQWPVWSLFAHSKPMSAHARSTPPAAPSSGRRSTRHAHMAVPIADKHVLK